MAVPMVVPTALMHQNSVIATAATVWANSFLGDKRRFIIPLLSRKGAAHRFAEDPSGRPYGTRYLLCRVEMNECRRLLCRGPVGKHSTLSKTFLSALLQESSRLRELSTDLRLCGSVPALGRFVCFLVMPFRMGGRRKSSITLPAKKGGKLKDMMQKGARRSERPHVNPLEILPKSTRIKTTARTRPRMPDGPYPHPPL